MTFGAESVRELVEQFFALGFDFLDGACIMGRKDGFLRFRLRMYELQSIYGN